MNLLEQKLINELYSGPMTVTALMGRLKVSQPTLSRCLKTLNNQIIKIGAGKNTRYILLRDIRLLGNSFPVFKVLENGECIQISELFAYQTAGFFLNCKHVDKLKARRNSKLFAGIPYFLTESRPQGFLGRSFANQNPDLNLPLRLQDWSENDFMVAIALRGENASGNLIVGQGSFDRFHSQKRHPLTEVSTRQKLKHYVECADLSLQGYPPGSSTGGEQPKFLSYAETNTDDPAHMIVKFTAPTHTPAIVRAADLLVAEYIALQILHENGIPAASSAIYQSKNQTFLESQRFDRIGPHGRKGLISMGSYDDEFFGNRSNWVDFARRAVKENILTSNDAAKIRQLYSFSSHIGNTDRHFGNVSFFWDLGLSKLKLAPAYDILPTFYSPTEGHVVERQFDLENPHPDALDEWRLTMSWAKEFWKQVSVDKRISQNFRSIAKQNLFK